MRASACEQLAVVDRLLQDTRVDVALGGSLGITWASRHGFMAVVDRLMQDPRVDSGRNDNIALYWATKLGHLAVADRLLRDRRVDAQVTKFAGFAAAVCGILWRSCSFVGACGMRFYHRSSGELDMDKLELVRMLHRHACLRRAHFATAVLRKWMRGRLGADTAITSIGPLH